jgi:hypothetical protein
MATEEKLPQADTILLKRVEYDSVLEQLKEVTHEFIDAFATPEDCPSLLSEALASLHAARLNLESATLLVGGEHHESH